MDRYLSTTLRVILSAALTSVLVAACSTANVGSAPATSTPTAKPRYTPIPTEAPAETAAPLAVASPSATPEPDWSKPPVPANDAAALAVQLATAERALRDPSLTGPKLTWFGHLQQLSYGRLADYPEWRESVLGALPPEIRSAVTNSLDAGKSLRSMGGPIPKTLPEWKIVEPAPIDDLLRYYKEAEAEFGMHWSYLAAIHLVETRMGRIRGLSSAGAQGPMQFMPATWKAYGKGDVNDDRDAIMAAGRYLKAAGAPGDMAKALFAYNRHTAYVKAIELYAGAMKADPAAYRGYHGWQVYYPTVDGPILMSVGWSKEAQ